MVEWKIKGLYKADAEAVYTEINALGEEFTPDMIVEAAKDENSELHKCFEWDDTIAADKYRKHQARMLVASLVVKTETTEGEAVAVRVISSTAARNVFKPTVMLIKQDQEYADLLARAIRELKAVQMKYKVVEELQDIFEAIEAL